MRKNKIILALVLALALAFSSSATSAGYDFPPEIDDPQAQAIEFKHYPPDDFGMWTYCSYHFEGYDIKIPIVFHENRLSTNLYLDIDEETLEITRAEIQGLIGGNFKKSGIDIISWRSPELKATKLSDSLLLTASVIGLSCGEGITHKTLERVSVHDHDVLVFDGYEYIWEFVEHPLSVDIKLTFDSDGNIVYSFV